MLQRRNLSVLMADNDDVLFSPEQEEWIKELVRIGETPLATTTVGTSPGIGSSPDNTFSIGNLHELISYLLYYENNRAAELSATVLIS